MSTPYSSPTPSVGQSSTKKWLGVVVFLIVAAIGLYWAKWDPYYHKSFNAAANHSIGSSIISGQDQVAAAPSWQAAWNYSLVYFKAIYKAMIVAVVLGSLVQVIVPRDWMVRLLGSTRFKSTALAGVVSLPGMM